MRIFFSSFYSLVVPFVLILSSCGGSSTSSPAAAQIDTTCKSGIAVISVGDGFMQIRCGCTLSSEAAGNVYTRADTLTCHLANRTSAVIFNFMGTVLRHQIIPTNSSQFVGSPMSNPNDQNSIRSYAVTFPKGSGTYSFQDAFSGLNGQIIVP